MGSDSRERSKSSVVSEWLSAESSITGIEGREGISCPSISCILRQTREGVSSMAVIVLFFPGRMLVLAQRSKITTLVRGRTDFVVVK